MRFATVKKSMCILAILVLLAGCALLRTTDGRNRVVDTARTAAMVSYTVEDMAVGTVNAFHAAGKISDEWYQNYLLGLSLFRSARNVLETALAAYDAQPTPENAARVRAAMEDFGASKSKILRTP